ncbi:unnamed protein product [Coregonus sp. 'balchen']|nr:unnamed protein product [Coregonus sp. 'balchen']
MSCMEQPEAFLNHVRDHHLIPEEMYKQYPTLRLLRNSLLDGSSRLYAKLPQNLEKEEKEEEEKEEKEKKRKAPGEGEEKEEGEEEKKTGKKKRKQKISESAKKEEQPSTSTQSTPSQKRKVQRPPYWTCGKSTHTAQRWVTPVELPVTWESCIVVQGLWFTPSGFEEFGGKKSSKNWKYSIRCIDTTLGKLIQV